MPRPRNQSPPAYCRHKASGQAVVRIAGKDHYLGPFGTPESHEAYERVISEWRLETNSVAARVSDAISNAGFDLTVTQAIAQYREFAKGYYSQGGEPTKEFVEMGYALKPLRELFGGTLAREFGPKRLKIVRDHMLDVLDLSRGVINARTKRIKRFFKWAVSEELVPANVSHALRDVAGLRKGRTRAREATPVTPVDDTFVDLVIPHLSPQIAAMVRVQRTTGMRPGEVVLMRACDIDMQGEVWIYAPHDHKNEWRDQARQIAIGPKTQEIIRPFITQSTDRYLFSPRDAEIWRNEQRALKRNPNRKTKIYPSELQARARRKSAAKDRQSKRPKRERYDVDSYRRAIDYAIQKLNGLREQTGEAPVPKWFPNQLRHSRATEVRREFGIEAAQVMLGHTRADVTQVYAERNLNLAIQIAKASG